MKTYLRYLLLIFVLLLCTPSSAFAEKFKAEYDSSTKIITVFDKNGNTIAKLQEPAGGKIYSNAAGSSKYIYYNVVFESDNAVFKNYLYRYQRSNGKITRMKKLPDGFYHFTVEECIGSKIYLTGHSASALVSYIYDGKTKTATKVKVTNGGFDYKYGSYFVMTGLREAGHFYGFPVYLYNYKTGKATRLCKYSDCYTVNGRYLYYSVLKSKNFSAGSSHKIMRADLKTGKKKTLVNNIPCLRIKTITKDMVEYYITAQALSRYYLKNGNTYRISESTPSDYVPVDKTKQLKGKFQKVLNHFVNLFALTTPSTINFNYREESGLYNTAFILQSDLGIHADGKTVAQISNITKKYLKQYFNTDQIFLVTVDDPATAYLTYSPASLYRISENGTIRYYGGNWGEREPSGNVKSVTKVTQDLFQAEYTVNMKNKTNGTLTHLGDFIVTFKKADSSYYITDIVRIYSAVERV